MAIRRPSIYSPTWVFQDFLYSESALEQSRYLQIKWDGEKFDRISETFDYSNPPYVGPEQRGGDIVGQIDYTVSGKLVTINDWSVDWRDEWPLRLAVNYLINCIYNPSRGYVIRVSGQEVYNQAGEAIPVADKHPIAFWVSESFDPLSNAPDDYLVRLGYDEGTKPPVIKYIFSSYVQRLVDSAQIVVRIEPFTVPQGEVLSWKIEGVGVDAAYLIQGPQVSGAIRIDEYPTFLNIPLVFPTPIRPGGPPYTVLVKFFADPTQYVFLGETEVEIPLMP